MNVANSSTNGSISPTTSSAFCEPSDDYHLYNQISLAPATLIIVILMFMKRRVVKGLDCWDGRPGILPPFDSLGSERNRFSYANAYANMAVAVTILFSNKITGKSGQVLNLPGPPWVAVFDSIVTIVLLGVIFLPMFLALSTPAKLLGAIMGFLYTSMRLAFLLVVALQCPLDRNSFFFAYPILLDLPTMLAHVFLIVRYAVIFVQEVRKMCNQEGDKRDLLLGVETEFKINPNYEAHVRTLLQGRKDEQEVGRKWYHKGRDFVYTPNPDFKYSVSVLSTVIVGGIIIYELAIMLIGGVVGYIVKIRKNLIEDKDYWIFFRGEDWYNGYVQILDISIGCFVVSTIVGGIYMYFQMYRMMVSHRHHVIKLMKGDRHFLPRKLPTPDNLVGISLRYCGYQIAYFIWGYIIITVILSAITIALALAIIILPAILTPDLKNLLLGLALGLVPTICLTAFVWLFQKILAVLVFKDRTMDSKVVNINNRRCYLLISFFFFFFNILVGLVSCFLRILKGMLLGILFIGRIDRPLLMKGFTSMDTAYMAYIGFLHLQVAHKHPVVLVYCNMLWENSRYRRMRRTTDKFISLDESPEPIANGQELRPMDTKPTYPRVSAWALNKWFVAVTIIHNPTLILNRKGFLKNIILGLHNTQAPSSIEVQALASSSPQRKTSQVFPHPNIPQKGDEEKTSYRDEKESEPGGKNKGSIQQDSLVVMV